MKAMKRWKLNEPNTIKYFVEFADFYNEFNQI